MADYIFLATCQGCQKDLELKFFEENGKEYKRCQDCRERRQKPVTIKQICQECGIKARFNFELEDKGIRCLRHKIDGMVNIATKEYTEKRFRRKIDELGGKILGEYKNVLVNVKCICINNHECNPRPSHVLQGHNICKICIGIDRIEAGKNFVRKINEIGGQVLGEYINAYTPVKCSCPNRHICKIRPSSIQQGNGMCVVCAALDPKTSEQNFLKRIHELGGQVIGEYINSTTPVNTVCSKGHRCSPRPGNVQSGQGMCDQCGNSGGETLLYMALCELKFIPMSQAKHPSIPTLRYDCAVMIKDRLCYIEYHGIQHEKPEHFFNKTRGFEKQRQMDLLKAYVAKINNIKLIVLDHTWAKKPLEEWVKYLDKALKNKKQLIADSKLHNWVSDEPSKETLAKYLRI
jgi:hypothetical protein